MRFTKIIGNVDSSLIAKAESALTKILIELGLRYNNYSVGNNLGGDPFLFSMLHLCESWAIGNSESIQKSNIESISTAATDGKRFYWNVNFVLNQTPIGLRLIAAHESMHAIFMHPNRRGNRIPKLWNIAVDFIVNNMIMEDLKLRKKDSKTEVEAKKEVVNIFTKNLGKFITFKQYSQMLIDPFSKIDGLDELYNKKQNKSSDKNNDNKNYFFFADPDLPLEMKRPEKIYDYFYKLLPKCPKCGRVGIYHNKENNKYNNGNKCKCEDCNKGYDILERGDLLDNHIDCKEDEEKLAKKITDIIESAKRISGKIPAGLEEELNTLTKPKVSWKDIIRSQLFKTRTGNKKNDWTKFKSRPMFGGILAPKKKKYFAKFAVILDTSGSMSTEDMSRGISQLQSLDERNEGIVIPVDSEVYWNKVSKLKNTSKEELLKIKIIGRGGTVLLEAINEYEKHVSTQDFMIIITDSFFMDSDLYKMKNPKIPVYWLVTSNNIDFKPPFGRVINLIE